MENFYINNTDKKICIKKSKEKLKKILSDNLIHADTKSLSKEENTQARKLVEEGAIEVIKQYLWEKNYWVLREQQSKGPTDLYAYKVINGKKIEFYIDAKGIRGGNKKKVQGKPSASKFPIRDRILRRIVGIVHLKDENSIKNIMFIEGWHKKYQSYKTSMKKGITVEIN
tara:strand:- start:1774 stop:2283 length:510 start_codon:yes stop_codon:yes gene_type:complete